MCKSSDKVSVSRDRAPAVHASHVDSSDSLGHSRSSRRRRGAAAHQAGRLEDLCVALNELDGFDGKSGVADAVDHRRLLAGRVKDMGAPPPEFNACADGADKGRVALNQLLADTADYAGEAQSVAPIDISRLSVPAAGGVGPVPLEVALGAEGPRIVAEFLQTCVLPTHQAAANIVEAKIKQPYIDPKLTRSPKTYLKLLCKLYNAGMLNFRNSVGRCMVGVFTVKKKDGKQRLVVDARVSNQWFSTPPSTQLPTGSAFAQVQGSGFCVGGLDLKDAFYNLGLPESLQDLFCLPGV